MMTFPIILGAMCLLYLFLVFPKAGSRGESFAGIRFAHRGLHGDGVTENTAAAFRLAVESGYGMEFDVCLSSDRIPVVIHDDDLLRVFGRGEKVSELTAEELIAIGVPTLEKVLEIAGGRVPLLVEIKGETSDTSVCAIAAELLDQYGGAWCMESFNPLYVRWFRVHRPQIVRGQLASCFSKKNPTGSGALNVILRSFLLNFLCRPDFVAYDCRFCDSFAFRLERLLGASAFAWTVRSAEEERRLQKYYDSFIFEGYLPASADAFRDN